MVNDVGPAWVDAGEAIGDLDQSGLEDAYLTMQIAAELTRQTLSDLPPYPPGDRIRVAAIRLMNDSERLLLDLVEARTWIEVGDYVPEMNRLQERIERITAQMDAAGFGRGAICD
jgi:hypothetical protein